MKRACFGWSGSLKGQEMKTTGGVRVVEEERGPTGGRGGNNIQPKQGEGGGWGVSRDCLA